MPLNKETKSNHQIVADISLSVNCYINSTRVCSIVIELEKYNYGFMFDLPYNKVLSLTHLNDSVIM